MIETTKERGPTGETTPLVLKPAEVADTLVARVLQGVAQDGPGVPALAVNAVVGVDTLRGESDESATISGYGPIPADLLRDWIRDGLDAGVEVTLRRLFAPRRPTVETVTPTGHRYRSTAPPMWPRDPQQAALD